MELPERIDEKWCEQAGIKANPKIQIKRRNNVYGIFIGSEGNDRKGSRKYRNVFEIIIFFLQKYHIENLDIYWEYGSGQKYNPVLIENQELIDIYVNKEPIDFVEKIQKILPQIKHPAEKSAKTNQSVKAGNMSPVYIESKDIKEDMMLSIYFDIRDKLSFIDSPCFIKRFLCKLVEKIKKILLSKRGFDELVKKCGYFTACIINARRGQYNFRQGLLNLYDSKCPMTFCEIKDLLEAAHIVPYSKCKGNYELESSIHNGILLRTDIHTLFDLGYISLEETNKKYVYEIIIDKSLEKDPLYKKIFEQLKENGNRRISLKFDDDKLKKSLHIAKNKNMDLKDFRDAFLENLKSRNEEHSLNVPEDKRI